MRRETSERLNGTGRGASMYGLNVKRLYVLIVVLACGGALTSRAANPGDEVIIVYNTRVPESKGVADYYAERRHVPASQIYGFPPSTKENQWRAGCSEGEQ